jgi:hypothetical protein
MSREAENAAIARIITNLLAFIYFSFVSSDMRLPTIFTGIDLPGNAIPLPKGER